MEGEKESYASCHRRYGSQPISIPFLWEQKPGMPKRDWTYASEISAAKPGSFGEAATRPIKLVISVPFQWEEKPGQPLLLMDQNPGSLDQDDPAFQESSIKDGLNRKASWYSVPESGFQCASKSSAMQNDGINNCFLDFLFRLPNPNVGFLGRVYENNCADPPDSCIDSQSHLVKKRNLTLGELILLSRNLSSQKNPVYIRNRSFFSMVKPSLHFLFHTSRV